MDKQTVCLLRECSSGCKMAINSLDQVRDFVKKRKNCISYWIPTTTQSAGRGNRKAAGKKWGREGSKLESTGPYFLDCTTEMKLMSHDDSSQIAKLLMDGCNMGMQSIGKFLNQYEQASAGNPSLAKKLTHMEEH